MNDGYRPIYQTANKFLQTSKEKDYLRWRYAQHPVWKYDFFKTDAFLFIFKRGERDGLAEVQLLDIISICESPSAKDLKKGLREVLRIVSPDIITAFSGDGFFPNNLLAKTGFIHRPSRGNFYIYEPSGTKFIERNIWSTTGGDYHMY